MAFLSSASPSYSKLSCSEPGITCLQAYEAVSGLCRFCRKRFFGDNEIFTHMQQKHEQCFLCRRGNPNKHVYYRDYRELEGALKLLYYFCIYLLPDWTWPALLCSHTQPLPSRLPTSHGGVCRAFPAGALCLRASDLPGEQVCGVRN